MKRKTKIISAALIAVVTTSSVTYYLLKTGDLSVRQHTIHADFSQDCETETESVLQVHEESETLLPDGVFREEEDRIEAEEEKIQTQHPSDAEEQSDRSEKNGHYEERNVLVKEAYDEQVLVKKGECHSVLVKNAYDEEVWQDGAWYGPDTLDAKVCNGCGAIFYGSISEHMSENPDHGGWHNESIAQGEPYWHGTKKAVHHDAVYETRCEPDEYETVHHEAVYRKETVWVDD